MIHFVSTSCTGEMCQCGKAAKHKVGEEIPSDEPCLTCGESWHWSSAPRTTPACDDLYHLAGSIRRNLTSYVCCACFTSLFGTATGCALTTLERKALAYYEALRSDTILALTLLCPRCGGDLDDLVCRGCKTRYRL